MSEGGGLIMFWGFYFKATNSLDALILHIVFNLLSLFSISSCPPPLSVRTTRLPQNCSVSSSQAARRGSSLRSPEIVDIEWKEEKLNMKSWPSRLMSNWDANPSCAVVRTSFSWKPLWQVKGQHCAAWCSMLTPKFTRVTILGRFRWVMSQ